jgi:hypothetical protein
MRRESARRRQTAPSKASLPPRWSSVAAALEVYLLHQVRMHDGMGVKRNAEES